MRRLIYLLFPTLLLFGCQSEDLPTAISEDEEVPLETTRFKTAEHEQSQCWLVTFEGGGHLQMIYPETNSLVPETPIQFAYNWATFIGVDPPSPTGGVVALWGNIASAEITFEQPMSRVSFYAITFTDLFVNAYDVDGNIIATAQTEANNTLWVPMTLDAVHARIVRLKLIGFSFATAIDDLEACQVSLIPIDLQPQNADNAVDLFNLSSKRPITVAVLSTLDFDAQSIDPGTATLDDPRFVARVAAQSSAVQDVNGDGLPDVVYDFGVARDLGDAGALDASSTLVELTAEVGGEEVFGTDDIKIVGGGGQ